MSIDLEKRTLDFSLEIIKFCKSIKSDIYNRPLVNQVLRSSTSIGANYKEAQGAISKKDFNLKVHICRKEANETKYWLILLKETLGEKSEEIDELLRECQEFILIFSKITATIRKQNDKANN